ERQPGPVERAPPPLEAQQLRQVAAGRSHEQHVVTGREVVGRHCDARYRHRLALRAAGSVASDRACCRTIRSPGARVAIPMIDLDAASFMLQWAVGGLFFTWVTTR